MRTVAWLDFGRIRGIAEEMRIRGMTIADSVCAASALSCIQDLDRVCMPVNVPDVMIGLRIVPHHLVMARYFGVNTRWPKLREKYEIVVPGFYERIVRECTERQLLRGNQPDVSTMLAAVAAHEVRHRLQLRSGLQWFTPGCTPGSNMLLQGIVCGLSQVFTSKRNELLKTVKDQNKLQTFWSDREFDSQVIERLVMHHGPACNTINELARFVLYEPTL